MIRQSESDINLLMLETALIIIGVVLLLLGIAGCLLPFLPGPPLAYASLLLLQLSDKQPFTFDFMLVLAGTTLFVVLADFYIPILSTRNFGGTRGGTRGATAGLIIGLFFPPFGIIAGPFIGAMIGELITGQNLKKALRSAFGSFIGFVGGTLMKLGLSIYMGYHFFKAIMIT